MRNRIVKLVSIAMALILILAALPAAADNDGWVSITIGDEKSAFERGGITLELYLIATGDYGDWTMLKDFSDITVFTRDDGSTHVDMTLGQIRKRIEERNIQPTQKADSDKEGKAEFKGLPRGIYFVMMRDELQGLKINPMLLSAPNKEGSVQIRANAKFEYETPTPSPTPTPKPTPTPFETPTPTPTPTPAPTPEPRDTYIYVKKNLVGREWKEGDEWTFTLQATGGLIGDQTIKPEEVPMPRDTKITVTKDNADGFTFGPLTFTPEEIGTEYTYTVTESGTVDGVKNDETPVREVSITVEYDYVSNSVILLSSTTEKAPLTFTNTYIEETPTPSLTPPPEETPTPPEETTTPPEETPTPPEETNTPEETPTPPEETVTPDETPTPTETPTEEPTPTPEPPAVETEIYVRKNLTGREWHPTDAWTFTLASAGGIRNGKRLSVDENPMPEKTVLTATQQHHESLSFGTIKFTAKDIGSTYTYTVTESGTVEGVKNDGRTTKTVTISVDYDAENNSLILGNSTSANQPQTFTNQYTPKRTKAKATPLPVATPSPVPNPDETPIPHNVPTWTPEPGETLIPLDDYETALGLGNIQMHVGVCFD